MANIPILISLYTKLDMIDVFIYPRLNSSNNYHLLNKNNSCIAPACVGRRFVRENSEW